jgi:hypothetical protein
MIEFTWTLYLLKGVTPMQKEEVQDSRFTDICVTQAN